MSDSRDVTGRWSGIYNYPRGLPPNPFTATLQETGGSFTGETIEPSPSPGYGGAQAHALLHGSRSGAMVSFVKH